MGGWALNAVSRLTCRLFGLYTGIVSVIRFYAAYNITNQPYVKVMVKD